MTIKIEYDGTMAKCWITEMHGHPDVLVPFRTADAFSQVYALGAFHCIKECWERERQKK